MALNQTEPNCRIFFGGCEPIPVTVSNLHEVLKLLLTRRAGYFAGAARSAYILKKTPEARAGRDQLNGGIGRTISESVFSVFRDVDEIAGTRCQPMPFSPFLGQDFELAGNKEKGFNAGMAMDRHRYARWNHPFHHARRFIIGLRWNQKFERWTEHVESLKLMLGNDVSELSGCWDVHLKTMDRPAGGGAFLSEWP